MAGNFSSYAKAGVDIKKVKGMHADIWEQISTTFSLNKGYGKPLPIYGHYGGLFEAENGRLLVIHTDGVGSKVLLAQQLGEFDTVGIDAMAMSVNDILCLGARPLVAVDYLAISKNDAELVSEITRGLVEGARQSACPIVGGETAILPGIIKGDNRPFDLAVTVVGEVHKDKLITGEKMKEGDVLVGLSSSGLHSNGYTLARKLLNVKKFGSEMLLPTRIYTRPILQILAECEVHGIAHITGGAFSKLSRIGKLANVGFLLDKLPLPSEIFRELAMIVKNDYELYRTFNMGIGMVVACPQSQAEKIISICKQHSIDAQIVGKVVKGSDVRLSLNGRELSLL